ncbi:hypothetical protein, partial [Bacillus atrophaeus]|uniref:hypothetical protein n=1 Tax=Bacillus atrophaeus TaxID=1452 RepID=UPI002E1DE5FB|nr:hypothetical protein [Bacillus atrophaeus]
MPGDQESSLQLYVIRNRPSAVGAAQPHANRYDGEKRSTLARRSGAAAAVRDPEQAVSCRSRAAARQSVRWRKAV